MVIPQAKLSKPSIRFIAFVKNKNQNIITQATQMNDSLFKLLKTPLLYKNNIIIRIAQ